MYLQWQEHSWHQMVYYIYFLGISIDSDLFTLIWGNGDTDQRKSSS
jgi:hypothetical protein